MYIGNNVLDIGQFNFIIFEIKGLLKIQIECDKVHYMDIFRPTKYIRILSYKQTKLLFRLTGGIYRKKFSLLRNRIQFQIGIVYIEKERSIKIRWLFQLENKLYTVQ